MSINHYSNFLLTKSEMEEPERFATVSEDAIDKMLSDKDSNNTKRSLEGLGTIEARP